MNLLLTRSVIVTPTRCPAPPLAVVALVIAALLCYPLAPGSYARLPHAASASAPSRSASSTGTCSDLAQHIGTYIFAVTYQDTDNKLCNYITPKPYKMENNQITRF